MLVHGLHRSTRIPLWGCYGLVGGVLAAVGGGLIAAGTRRAVSISIVPRETIAALGEVLDTMLAGAVVGAVTGAAQSPSHEPTAVTGAETLSAKAERPGTVEVVGEMASGAALGAISGVAKSILPAEKGKGSRKQSSRR